MTTLTGGALQVTLEPFTQNAQNTSNLSSSSGGLFSPSGSPNSTLPQLSRDTSLLDKVSHWNTPIPSPNPANTSSAAATPMDTSSNDTYKTSSMPPPSGSGSGTGKPNAKDGGSNKDGKYLENLLAGLTTLPDFVREKIGKIKGLEKAVMHKSAALKDASAYHVQMIHAKLTKKKDGDGGDSNTAASSTGGNDTTSGNSNIANNAFSNANFNTSSSSGNFNNSGGGGNGSGSYNNSSSSSNSNFNPATGLINPTNLPPLPHPSPLSQPLPFTLTHSVVGPLPTESLLNNLTYLLVAPVERQSAMVHAVPPPAPSSGPGSHSHSQQQLSKHEMGLMPMNLNPACFPPITGGSATGGKSGKSGSGMGGGGSSSNSLNNQLLSVQVQQALTQHPYASIPSQMEIASTAIQPSFIETPSHLTNEALAEWRKKSVQEYDLDQAEKFMKEHHAILIEWQKRKGALVTELYEQVDSLVKKAEQAVKKQESKLRRGAFEVPATPIDRRRIATPGSGASTASTTATTASNAAAAATATTDAARKRSYTTMLQEIESRELQYALQNELRAEIEKQSANAMATHAASSAALGLGGGMGSGLGSTGGSGGDVSEPIYCICKKVSFGAMVACDNEDCETEWFHFACVGLDTKPRGKWLCQDCKKKSKESKAKESKAKAGEESTSSKTKDEQPPKKKTKTEK